MKFIKYLRIIYINNTKMIFEKNYENNLQIICRVDTFFENRTQRLQILLLSNKS